MSFLLHFDSSDGSVLCLYQGVRMTGERSTGGWQGGVEGKSEEL